MKKLYITFFVAILLMAVPAALIASSTNDDAVISTIAGPTLDDIGLPDEDLRPTGLALDRKTGDVYIASGQNNRILKRDAGTGVLTLVAGTGESGFEGDNGPAVTAKLAFPRALAFARGMLFIADRNNKRVRVVNTVDKQIQLLGITIEPGHITTIAGTGVELWNGGDDSLAALGANIRPNGLAIDDEGNLFIQHTTSARVLFLNLQDEQITIPGQPNALLDSGHIVSVAGNGVITGSIDGEGGDPSDDLGDGGLAGKASFNITPNVDLNFNGMPVLLLADRDNHRVRVANLTRHTIKITGVKIKAGNIETVAGNGTVTGSIDGEGGDPTDDLGDGGSAKLATFASPTDVSIDEEGNIFITDSLGPAPAQPRIRRIDGKTGIISTIAGTGVVTSSIDGEGGDPSDDLGDGGLATLATFSSRNFNILLDKEDRVLISDNAAHRVRRIDAATND